MLPISKYFIIRFIISVFLKNLFQCLSLIKEVLTKDTKHWSVEDTHYTNSFLMLGLYRDSRPFQTESGFNGFELKRLKTSLFYSYKVV